MINTYQPEDANASLDQATHDLLASLRQSNPDLREIGQDENIRVNGVAGKSVDLIGNSPLRDQSGHPSQERDWLVAVMRRGRQPLVHSVDRPGQGLRSAASHVRADAEVAAAAVNVCGLIAP